MAVSLLLDSAAEADYFVFLVLLLEEHPVMVTLSAEVLPIRVVVVVDVGHLYPALAPPTLDLDVAVAVAVAVLHSPVDSRDLFVSVLVMMLFRSHLVEMVLVQELKTNLAVGDSLWRIHLLWVLMLLHQLLAGPPACPMSSIHR